MNQTTTASKSEVAWSELTLVPRVFILSPQGMTGRVNLATGLFWIPGDPGFTTM